MTIRQNIDEYYMAQCLELARLGYGNARPNPMVGAVVLNTHGQKVGEGYHVKAGDAHAEVMALVQAGKAAAGGTLYVSLEPCNHTGKTPPCTQAVIDAGIERVVCGTLDPNPVVAGSGRDTLQNHRISVRTGFLNEECYRLNEAFFHYVTTKRPFVTLKTAMTLDGKIATRNGKSQWLTGSLARHYVHHLRAGHDAILTTSETVQADNPAMTVRDVPKVARPPVRVILDRRFRLNPEHYKIFNTKEAPTWVFTSKITHNEAHAEIARQQGVKVLEVDEDGLGLSLNEVLTTLGKAELSSVFVEAGGRLCGSLLNQQLVNKLLIFYAPRAIPDTVAKAAFTGGTYFSLDAVPGFTTHHVQRLEEDILVEGYPIRKSKTSLL